MADQIVDLNIPGDDVTKGGIFFGSSLTPRGTFSNIPNYYTYNPTSNSQEVIELTLKKIKDSLKQQLQLEYDYTQQELDTVDNNTVEKFLYEFTNLLIDYRDLRNYVFFGSAHTEVAHNIQVLINTYPYQTLVSDLTSVFTKITIVNDNSKNQTTIIFDDDAIKDRGSFISYDTNPAFDWLSYDIVDKNQKRYEILNAIAPYESPSIPNISNITNGVNTIIITTSTPHNFYDGQTVQIYEVQGTLFTGETTINANGSFIIQNSQINPTQFEIYEADTKLPLIMNFTYLTGGKVRKLPLDLNTKPYVYKILINGILTFDQLINYQDSNDIGYTGFLISPKQRITNDFDFNLTPIQKMLLAPPPINNTPWPRRQLTDNIQNQLNPPNEDYDFIQWLQNPELLYIKNGSLIDDDVAYSDIYTEYNILRAQVLDETVTNNLVRRCIPADAISELNDPDDGYFQRFILIAGWFFDQIWVYVKFIKYVHTLNYGDFNQLSPQYYKYYADYYGFDLFSDDGIDFSKLVVQTEPGLSFTLNSNIDVNNKYYRYTLQQLQYERQKRLLLSLFYLYRIKGTQECIKQLVSLLGAPDGLLKLQEFAFQFNNVDSQDYVTNGNYSKTLIVDNSKVHVPEYHFEIDPDFLIDKTNINNPVNQPYVYRYRLHNESTINLRQIGINTDPAAAIDNHIMSVFGKRTFNFVKFNQGDFLNLQDLNNDFYYLPLSLPDKFWGISVNYMITRDGFVKGLGNNLEEVAMHIGSLILVGTPSFRLSSNINNISLSTISNVATITTVGNHSILLGDRILISGVVGITNINNVYTVTSIPNVNTLTIEGDFSGLYISGGIINPIIPNKVTKGFNTSYILPEVFANYSNDTILNPNNSKNPITDFNLLQRLYPNSNFLNFQGTQYIFNRIEGNDLVVRMHLRSEISPITIERVALFKNVFENDGLYHSLRLIFRAEGIEVYKDYKFVGLAEWRLPDQNNLGIPYLAFEIPKYLISTCPISVIPINDLAALGTHNPPDNIRWWDLFMGLPQNLEMYINKVEVFENAGIDDFNIGDRIINSLNSNADSYIFDFIQSTETSNYLLTTNCQFLKAQPVNSAVNYNYLLPISQNSNSTNIINNLTLTSKKANSIPGEIDRKYYPNTIQDFFMDGNPFQRYGWQKDIHQSYEYNNFNGKVNYLYTLYSPQVLTYNDLENFLSLIESKFKKTIQQFIPIVINISEFGRLIQNSIFYQPKMRYIGGYKECKGENILSNSSIQSKIFNEETQPVVITWQAVDPYCIQGTTTSTSTSTTSTSSSTTTSTTTLPPTTTTTTSTTTIPIPMIQITFIELPPNSSGLRRLYLTASTTNGPSTQNFSFRFGQCTDGTGGVYCNGYPTAPTNPSAYSTINFNIGDTSKSAYAGANAGSDGVITVLVIHGRVNISSTQISKAPGMTWDLQFQ